MKKTRKSKNGATGEDRKPSKVLESIRSLALLANEDSAPVDLLEDVRWMIDRGLDKSVWSVLEEELPQESSDAIVRALRRAASRLTLPGSPGSAAKHEELDRPQPRVLIPFALLISATYPADNAERFPLELPESIGRAVESGLMRDTLGIAEDVTLFFDPRLYHPQHHEWLLPSATRRYMKSIAAHLGPAGTSVTPLSDDYEQLSRDGGDPSPDELGICQRLFCGAIITGLGTGKRALEEAGEILFRDREGDESPMDLERLERFNLLIHDELAKCGIPEATVMANLLPIELWDVPRFVFQLHRTVSLGLAIEMAQERFRETEPGDRELNSVLYISMHGSDETLREFRFAAYRVDETSTEEDSPFFSYAWEIAFELEAPADIDDAIREVAENLNASVKMSNGLLADERCDNCGAKFFPGPGGNMYHDPDEFDEDCALFQEG